MKWAGSEISQSGRACGQVECTAPLLKAFTFKVSHQCKNSDQGNGFQHQAVEVFECKAGLNQDTKQRSRRHLGSSISQASDSVFRLRS